MTISNGVRRENYERRNKGRPLTAAQRRRLAKKECREHPDEQSYQPDADFEFHLPKELALPSLHEIRGSHPALVIQDEVPDDIVVTAVKGDTEVTVTVRGEGKLVVEAREEPEPLEAEARLFLSIMGVQTGYRFGICRQCGRYRELRTETGKCVNPKDYDQVIPPNRRARRTKVRPKRDLPKFGPPARKDKEPRLTYCERRGEKVKSG